jgi:hypothetical protein
MKQNEEIIEQAVAMLESYFMNYLLVNHIKTVPQGLWNQRTEGTESLWRLCKTKCDEITYATVKEVGISPPKEVEEDVNIM